MQEMWVGSLGQEDPLEKEMAAHSIILALENSMDRGVWQATVHGGHKESDTTEQLNSSNKNNNKISQKEKGKPCMISPI